MAIRQTIRNDVVILTLEGNFLCQPENTELKDKITSLLGTGAKRFIIDLGEVTCINSDGLGTLISALATLRRAGVELRLANTTDLVDNLLLLTQLVKIFDTYGSIEEALSGPKGK